MTYLLIHDTRHRSLSFEIKYIHTTPKKLRKKKKKVLNVRYSDLIKSFHRVLSRKWKMEAHQIEVDADWGGVYGVGGFLEGWMPLPGCGGGQMGEKREWSRCREKGVSEGDTNSPLGKGWTGVAAPILTLSENWGPHGDKEGGATLPRLLCVSKRGNGACHDHQTRFIQFTSEIGILY